MYSAFGSPEFPFYGRLFCTQPIPIPRSQRQLENDDVLLISGDHGANNYTARPLFFEETGAVEVEKTAISRLRWPSLAEGERVFVTVAPCSTSHSGYLSFDKGTMVIVVGEATEGEWFRGVVVGDNGKRLGGAPELLPASFLFELKPLSTVEESIPGQRDDVQSRFEEREILCEQKSESVKVGETILQRSIERPGVLCTALFDFTGSNEDELSFIAHEEIRVIKSINDVWFFGESIDGERRGMFPADFVDLKPFGITPTPPSAPETAPVMTDFVEEPDCYLGIAIAVSDFVPRFNDELAISYGDCVKVISFVDADWCFCYSLSRCGLVPTAFLNQLFSRPATIDAVSVEERPSSTSTPPACFEDDFPPTPTEPRTIAQAIPARSPPREVGPAKIEKEANCFSAKESEKRKFVVGEVISTEVTYQRNLKLWITFVGESDWLNDAEKLKLTSGFEELISLSQKLLTSLREEYAKDVNDQKIGAAFSALIERIQSTFLLYVDCYITTYSVDQAVSPEIFDSLIRRLRENGSSIFDAPSFFFEPFLRATRYRLLMEALLSNTPKGNADRANLLRVYRNIRNLLSAIDGRLGSRLLNKQSFLSGISSHSFAKKRNRLKYRIKAIFGQNIIKDYEFDSKMRSLVADERNVSRFLFCVNAYKRKFVLGIAKWREANTPNKNESVLPHCMNKLHVLFADSARIVEELVAEIEKNVIPEAKSLFGVADLKLIQRRNDKLADYEMSLGKKDVAARSLRKSEFDALNTKLINDLPKATETIRKKALELVVSLMELDRKYCSKLDASLRGRHSDIARMPITSHWSAIDPDRSRLRAFRKLVERFGGVRSSGVSDLRVGSASTSNMGN